MENSKSVYSLLISSAYKGMKYSLAHPIASHQHNVPHLFTLSLKLGSKNPVNISPVHVWFTVGSVKISSFVCLVGIGLGISSYIIYKIYKQNFPIRINNSILKFLGRNKRKSDKSRSSASSSCSDSSHGVDGGLEAIRRKPQNSDRQHRRRKVVRTKHASPGTDSDVELGDYKAMPFDGIIPSDLLNCTSGHSTDLGFVSMKSSLQVPPQVQKMMSEDQLKAQNVNSGTRYSLVDDHCRNRFVITPIDLNASQPCHASPRFANNVARDRMQSTPDELLAGDYFLDLEELNSGSRIHGTSHCLGPRNSNFSDSGSDSDRTGISLSQPSSEMFDAAKDIVLSGTLNEMENLQSQLDLLSNDVDDLNGEVENLQKREDPKETVSRRYTLGAEEALTVKKKTPKETNQRKANRSKTRFLRKLGLKHSLTTSKRAKSCDLLGSDNSEEGVMALVENTERTWDNSIKSSFISKACSELEQLSSDGSLSDDVVNLSGMSNSSIAEEGLLEDLSQSLPRNAPNKTFLVQVLPCETSPTNSKSRQTKHDVTDDLYIDDDLLSPPNSDLMKRSKRSSCQANDLMSPMQLVVRPQSLLSFGESGSIYQTPDRSCMSGFLSPWPANERELQGANYSRLMSTDGQLNFMNNNVNINLISELLFLSSHDGPLSPQTSNFLATCMESPARASAEVDSGTLRRFMEKIGEAVVNFSSTNLPLKRCNDKAFSTPIGQSGTAGKGCSKNFLGSLDKLCSSFPFWLVKNLDEPVDTLEYAGKKFCANTESHIYQGYAQICKLVGARNICSVRRDCFCSIRATFCQGIISNKFRSFSEMFKEDFNRLMEVLEMPGNEYLRSSCFSNRIPFNKGSEMEVMKTCFDLLLNVITSQEAIHSKVHDLTQKQEQLKSLLDGLFNGCPIVDLHLMEAIKMVMMIRAIDLFRSFSSNPSRSKPLAWAIFSGKSTRNPEQLFRNRMCAIGDTLSPNKTEMSLLAHSLRIKLEVLKPALYLGHSEDFVLHYPDEGVDDLEKVTIIEEADNAFLLILQ